SGAPSPRRGRCEASSCWSTTSTPPGRPPVPPRPLYAGPERRGSRSCPSPVRCANLEIPFENTVQRTRRWVVRLQVKARNFDLSPEIRAYAESKFSRLGKQLAEGTTVEVELAEETKRSQQTAEATVFAKGST